MFITATFCILVLLNNEYLTENFVFPVVAVVLPVPLPHTGCPCRADFLCTEWRGDGVVGDRKWARKKRPNFGFAPLDYAKKWCAQETRCFVAVVWSSWALSIFLIFCMYLTHHMGYLHIKRRSGMGSINWSNSRFTGFSISQKSCFWTKRRVKKFIFKILNMPRERAWSVTPC